ncbi:MAG: CBS domain-containing protein [Planctomycetes bacterium]|nr:CBS domain-containing protein [Planctomycetota bacterium]
MKLLLARDLMKKDLVTILASESIDTLAALLDEEEVHGVPVVDGEGHPVGVVGSTDIARAVAEQAEEGGARPTTRVTTVEGSLDLEEIEPPPAERMTLEGRVADIMSDRIVRAPETATAGELSRLMLKEGVHRILITDGRRLVGLVSATDLLRCLPDYESALLPAPKGKRG